MDFFGSDKRSGPDPLDGWAEAEKAKEVERQIQKPQLVPAPKNATAETARVGMLLEGRPDLLNGVNVPAGVDVLQMMHDELSSQLGGNSTVLKTIKANVARDKFKAEKKKLETDIGMTPDGQLKEEMVQQWQVLDLYDQADDDVVEAQASIIDPLIDIAYYKSNTPLGHEDFRARMINAAMTHQAIGVEESIRWLAEYSDDVSVVRDWGIVPNVAELLLPVAHGIRMGLITRELLPDEWSITDFVLPGEANEKIKKAMVNAAPEQRAALVQDYLRVVETYMGDNASWLLANDLEKYIALSELRDSLTEYATNDDSVNWTRVMENMFGVISVIPGVNALTKVPAVVRAIKGEKGYRGTFNQALYAQVVSGHQVLDQAIMAGADDGIEALAQSREALINTALPSPIPPNTSVLTPIPASDAVDLVTSDALIANEMARRAAETPLPRATWDIPEAPDAFKQRALRTIRDTVGAHINIAKSFIGNPNHEAEEFVFRAVVGRDNKHGFATLDDAIDAQNNYQLVENASVMKYDSATHAFIPADAADYGKGLTGEFYIVKDYKLGFNDGMLNPLHTSIERNAGVAGNWATTAMQRYTGELREFFRNAVRGGAAFREKLRVSALPYDNLTSKERVAVDDVLYAHNGVREFTPTELRAQFGFNDNQVNGYLAYRDTMNAGMSMLDKQLRAKALADGKRWITIPGKLDQGDLAKHYIDPKQGKEAFRGDRTQVYDSVTDTFRSMTNAEVDTLYANGGSLVRLEHPIENGIKQVQWVSISNGSTAAIRDLPSKLIKRLPGYMPRFVDHQYAVYATRPMQRMDANGNYRTVADRHVIAFAANKAEADKMVQKLTVAHAMNPSAGLHFTADATPNLQAAWHGNEQALFEVENLMFYQKRNDALMEIEGRRTYVDPAVALDRFTASMANKVFEGRVVENYQAAWQKAYGYLFPDLAGGFPKDRSVLRNTIAYTDRGRIPINKTKEQYKQDIDNAIAGFDFINSMTRGPTSFQRVKARYMAEKVGMALAGTQGWAGAPARVVGNWLVSNPDPIRFARTAAFVHQILSAPVKQWVINSTTLSLHAGIDAPKALRAMVSDALYLDVMYQAEKANVKYSPNLFVKAVTGVDNALLGKDMQALHRAFTESGFAEIHSNSVTMDRTAFGNDAVKTVGTAKDKMLHTAGELGSASAERHNAGAAFSFAARRHAEATGKTFSQFNRKDWREVVDKGAGYGLSMTKEDAYNYQRGLFAATFQYFAIRQKAAFAITLGTDMTKAQKGWSAAIQMGLFGAEGIGAAYAVNEMFNQLGWDWEKVAEEIRMSSGGGGDLSGDELKRWVNGGLADGMYNYMLDDLFKEQGSDVNLARAVSPLAGVDRTVIALSFGLTQAIQGNYDPITASLLGASESVLGNYHKMYNDMIMMAKYDMKDDLAVDRVLRDAAMLTSGGSNLVKMVEGRAMQAIVDRNGSPLTQATLGELRSKGIIGLSSEREDEFWDAKAMMGMEGKKAQQEVDAMSSELGEYYFNLIIHSEDHKTLASRLQWASAVCDTIEAEFPDQPFLADAVRDELGVRLSNFGDPKVDAFYKRLVDKMYQNKVDDPKKIIATLRNTKYARNDPRFLSALDDLTETLSRETDRIKARGDE